MQVTAIDAQTLNGPEGIVVVLRASAAAARSVTATTRQRSYLPPALDDVRYNAWSRELFVYKADASALTPAEFDDLVQGIFNPDGRARTLTGEHQGQTYTMQIYVQDFLRTSKVNTWTATVLATDPYWLSDVEVVTGASPLAVTGNVVSLPSITITDGAPVTRRRVLITHPHPLMSYPVAVNVGLSAADHVVYHRGRRIPYAWADGYLYCRIDTDLPRSATRQTAMLDVFSGTSINNTLDADMLDPAGLTLAPEINSGTFISAPALAPENPLPPSFSWQPANLLEDETAGGFTFGLQDGALQLLDVEQTGEKRSLPNDANAIQLISPVELASLQQFGLRVRLGYRRGQASAQDAGAGAKRVMRVTIADIDGGLPDAPRNPPWYQHPNSRHPDVPYYAQWGWGGTTFPNTQSQNVQYIQDLDGEGEVVGRAEGYELSGGTVYVRQEWIDDYLPSEFQQAVERFIGCPVTTGLPGVYYLHFDADNYAGIEELPLLTMQIQAKSGEYKAMTFYDPYEAIFDQDPDIGNAALEYAPLFEAIWVDPTTLEPFDEDLPEQDLVGVTKVAITGWLRDSEYPVTLWERTLRGAYAAEDVPPVAGMSVASLADGGVEYSANFASLATPGVVKLAIGLYPAAANPNEVEWGELEVVDHAGSVRVQASATPSIIVEDVPAQHLNGTLSNNTTLASISFTDVFSDAGGLEINTAGQASHEVISGAGGVGPVYGFPLPSNGVRWFDLTPGDNVWSATGRLTTATILFRYAARRAVNS